MYRPYGLILLTLPRHIFHFPISRTKLYLICIMCTLAREYVTLLGFTGGFEYQNTDFLLLSRCGMAQSVSHWPNSTKSRLSLGLVGVEFVVQKVTVEQVFLRVLRFSPVSIIQSLLHNNSFKYHRHLQKPSNLKSR